MKIAIKNKNTFKYVDAESIEVDGVALSEVIKSQRKVEQLFMELVDNLQDKHIVKSDAPYIVKVGDELKRVDKLVIFEDVDTKLPLRFYELKDGEIVMNNRKVASL